MEDMTGFALATMIPFFCIGAIFILIGYVVRYFMRKRLHRCSEMVSGKVVDIDRYSVKMNRNLSKVFYRPLIEFKIGKEIFRAVPPNGASKAAYELGEDILIYYNPNEHNEIIIRSEFDKEVRKVFFVFLIMGLCVPVFGIILGWGMSVLMDNFV